MKPTNEQLNIVSLASLRKNLAVTAFAGAAKTTTCKLIAEAVTRPSLYIAFNKTIADEASGKFPIHVDCKTIHSVAYNAIVKPLKMFKKVSFGMDTKEVLELFDKELELYNEVDTLEVTFKVLDVLKCFCQSANYSVADFTYEYLSESMDLEAISSYIPLVEKLWSACIDPKNSLKITHDVYLKMYQLSKPLLTDYEVIYLDEAQDSNPVTLDIFFNQPAQLIMVGDPYQSIYEWRGAINAFDLVPKDFVHRKLTQSFRFGRDIADLATKLTYIAGNDDEIIGLGSKTTDNSLAVICRTNTSILQHLLEAGREGKKVYVLADLTDLWSKLYHISALIAGHKPKFPNRSLKNFVKIDDLRAEAEHNPELKKLLNIYSLLATGRGLHANIVAIKEIIVKDVAEANFTISTIHKSKGLEWARVIIDDDILDLEDCPDSEIAKKLRDSQTLNCIYVAVTRAINTVSLPASVNLVLSIAPYLRSSY